MGATEQAASKGQSGKMVPVAGVIFSVLYLLNLSAGIVEIPDNLPLIGNLDEVFFSGMLFASLAALGIHLPGLGPRTREPNHDDPTNNTNK